MFIVSIMFYLFGFERPPPYWSKSRSRRKSATIISGNKTCLVLLFLVLLKLASGAADLEEESISEDDGDEDGDDDEDDDDDYDDNDDEIDLSIADKVTSSYDLYKLKRSLLNNYDKGARPLINSQQPIKVFMRIKFVQINHLDEVLQV